MFTAQKTVANATVIEADFLKYARDADVNERAGDEKRPKYLMAIGCVVSFQDSSAAVCSSTPVSFAWCAKVITMYCAP